MKKRKRFTTFVYSRKALTWMAEEVVGDKKGSIAVGFDDWMLFWNDEKANYVPCHFVLRCLNPECNTIWQRDVNASRNIMDAFKCQMKGQARPQHLERRTLSNPVIT